MLRLRTLMLASALVLGATSALHAQDFSCPLTSRMTFHPNNSPTPYNLRDGASYAIWLGRTTNALGVPVLGALVQRNGVCEPVMRVRDGAGQTIQLTTNTNLCLGNGRDVVTVIKTTSTIDMCGTSRTLTPFAYNGRRLATYAGGSADIVFGGTGKDHVFGGGGADILYGGSGSEDELYGESGDDVVNGSTGSATFSSGGLDMDTIVDSQGSNDWLSGDDGDDAVVSYCNSALLFCGPGNDAAVSPDPEPLFTDCEDWNVRTCG